MPTLLAPEVDNATRREFVAALAAAGLLTGCASGSDRPAPAATRVVRDADGVEVTIPADPRRVVVTDNVALPWVLELGVVPVAAGTFPGYYDGRDFEPTLYPLGAGEVAAFSRDEPAYELVAAEQPDLIIGSGLGLDGGRAARYRDLAPVVSFDNTVSPFEQLRAVAVILGREQRAEERIAAVEAPIRALAADVPVETISVLNPIDTGSFFAYTEAEPVTALLAQLLGVRVVPGAEIAGESGAAELSTERLGELTGEALIVLDRDDEGRGLDEFRTTPLWPTLPAVAAGRVHNAGSFVTYGGGAGLDALRDQLTNIATFLTQIR